MKFKLDINRISYICIVVGYILTLTTIPQGEEFGNIFVNIGLFLALYKIFFLNSYTFKQMILFGIIGTILFVVSYQTRNYQFMYTFIFALSATKMSMDKLIDIDLIVRIPLVFIVCALGYSGIILNRVDDDFRGLGLVRKSLGFSHPNNLGVMMMIITIYLFYKKHKHFAIRDYLLLLFADYICWSVAISRTSSIVITTVIAVELLDSVITALFHRYSLEKFKQIVMIIGSAFTLIIPLGSVYLGINYSATPFYLAVDSVLNSRVYLMNTAFRNNGIPLWGQYIKVTSWASNVIAEETNAIDNLYGYILINFGAIFFGLCVLALFISFIYAYKKGEWAVCLCILFFIAAGFCENKMFYLGVNAFTVYIAVAFYQSSRRIRYREHSRLRRKKEMLGEKVNG